MSTSAPISADEFQALEQKVLRAVEIVKREREARASAEAEIGLLQQKISELHQELSSTQHQLSEAKQRNEQYAAEIEQHTTASEAVASELSNLQQERADVRLRVEKMLQQMDELL